MNVHEKLSNCTISAPTSADSTPDAPSCSHIGARRISLPTTENTASA